MVAARQHIVEARFEQRVGEVAGVEDEDAHHLFEVFDGRLDDTGRSALDALGWHRRKQTHAAGTAAHQHQFADALRPVQGEGHRAMAAHRVAQQMDLSIPS